ncbi:MAG: 50S ribosomal protein L15e [Nanoarchaeota archaeon]
MKGLTHYLREAWKNPRELELWRARLIEWRKTPAIVRVESPTRLDRAHALGYKAKQGFVIVRVKLKRGGRKRPRPTRKGRRSKRQTIRKILRMNYQWVAEQRAARKYKNLEVLNSYWVAKDGQHYFYEIIMVDPQHPQIKNDKKLKWLADGKHRGRAFRGLTSAARKSRGLRWKGKGTEKSRPSRRAAQRRLTLSGKRKF